MNDLGQALRQALQRKQRELKSLENQVVVLHSLINMAEEEEESVDPAQPIPPQRASAPAQPAKIVKRFP